MTSTFRVLWTVKGSRTRSEAIALARKAVGERLASKGRIVRVGPVLTSTEPDPTGAKSVEACTVQLEIQTFLPQEKLGKLFDPWKIAAVTVSKPALAGSGAPLTE
jgi:hypothetical protein